MKTIEGKAGIKATVICDSVSSVTGTRLITWELEYPRIILAEQNTHRMLSKNSASSRAIPFAKMKEQLTGIPVRFGKNVSGMQDAGEWDAPVIIADDYKFSRLNGPLTAKEAWDTARDAALCVSQAFATAGYHKQVYNRLTEPFQMMKTVLTGTEVENYFWLRNHGAADPTIAELARCMFEARRQSKPQVLKPGEWHLPYVGTCISEIDNETRLYFIEDGEGLAILLDLEDAIKVSCARSAAVSFRNTDYGVEKSREVYERLVGDDRKHASAFEHCATPMRGEYVEYDYLGTEYDDSVNVVDVPSTWQEGITHADRDGNLWSGNFKNFIQYRKLIPGENYAK